MKGSLFFYILVIGLTCFAGLNSSATKSTILSSTNDKVIFFSDRSLYITGEEIFFSVVILNKTNIKSKVLYVELITADGNKVITGKFPIEEQKANGCIAIPTEMLTGVYYIKAYTRWMRNFNVSDYSFTPIKIVNPYRSEILQSNRPSDQIITNLPYSSQAHYSLISITTNESVYSTREKGNLTLSIQNNAQEINGANLSIIPSASIYSKVPFNYSATSNEEQTLQLYPETKGISISGKIVDKESDLPKPYAQVNLSILGSSPDFIAMRTDSIGKFNFALPHLYGKTDLYIGIEEKGNSIIKVDNDFCTREIQLPVIPFELSEAERIAASNMVKNIEVKSKFMGNNAHNQSSDDKSTSKPFYGTPDNIFYFDKFINLLSVQEYFHELLPNVSVRTKAGKSVFKIFSNEPEMQVYEPLVLIDFIAVDRIDRILAANPNLLSRIDIVTKPYYKGDMIFGGIISFFSQKGDFAGIDLPASDLFVEFEFFSPNASHESELEILPNNLPDTRNTLNWYSNLNLENNKSVSLDFQTPDTPGEYTILFRGINDKGELVQQSATFVVE